MRKIYFQNDHYYHVYNRGVDKREVFCDENDYIRFLICMREFNRKDPIGSLHLQKELQERRRTSCEDVRRLEAPLVEIISYCLNFNHFHFLLKQLKDGGISEYIKRLIGGYTKYFNYKNTRTGSLFGGKFKSVPIITDAQMIYLAAYINGNVEIHKIAKARDYQWSSCPDFLGVRNGSLCNPNVILDQFSDISEYGQYLDEVINGSKAIKDEMKKSLLE